MMLPIRSGTVGWIGLMAGLLVTAPDPTSGDQDAARKKPEAMALLADGQRVSATLVKIDGPGRLVVDTAEGRQQWSARDWLVWGSFRDRDRGTAILLASGAVLMGDIVAIESAAIQVDPVWFEPVTLPKSAVRAVVWRLPVHPTDRDRLLRRMTTSPVEQDTVWLVNGDRLEGVVSSWPQVPGAWTHLRAAGVTDQPPAEVAIENVTGVALTSINQQSGLLPSDGEALCVGLSDGSRLWVRTVSMGEGKTRFELMDGVTLVAEPRGIWAAVTGALRMGPDVTYLSDMPNLGFKHLPYLERAWGFGQDRNAGGGLLRVGDQIYVKGLGMHGTSRLAYDLNQQYERLEAEIALDKASSSLGSVVFRVLVERLAADGDAGGWEVAYESPVVRPGDRPQSLSIDVTRAARLALIVDSAVHGDIGDWANWLHARLRPREAK